MKLTEILDQIDRLDKEAEAGPWRLNEVMGGDYLVHGDADVAEAWGLSNSEFIALARTALPQLAKALQAVIKTLDDYPLPQKQYDPTGIALAELSTLEQRLREAITDAMEADDAS